MLFSKGAETNDVCRATYIYLYIYIKFQKVTTIVFPPSAAKNWGVFLKLSDIAGYI